jgi:hypothetical protein
MVFLRFVGAVGPNDSGRHPGPNVGWWPGWQKLVAVERLSMGMDDLIGSQA